MELDLKSCPVVVAIAGPNGAGKSTFFEAHFSKSGLRFVNADVVANELGIDAYEAAKMAEQLRQEMVARKESFVFETVLSDPYGVKVEFLRQTAKAGYTVLFYFIGLDSAARSDRRVSARVLQGGHDVPTDKLIARYQRTLENLARALRVLPNVWVYDNSSSDEPFRFVAEYREGVQVQVDDSRPAWFGALTGGQDA